MTKHEAATGSRSSICCQLTEGTLNATQDLIEIYSTCYHVLCAIGDPRAGEVLATGHALLQERAARISDAALRHSFLENVPYQRKLVAAWREHQAHHDTLAAGEP